MDEKEDDPIESFLSAESTCNAGDHASRKCLLANPSKAKRKRSSQHFSCQHHHPDDPALPPKKRARLDVYVQRPLSTRLSDDEHSDQKVDSEIQDTNETQETNEAEDAVKAICQPAACFFDTDKKDLTREDLEKERAAQVTKWPSIHRTLRSVKRLTWSPELISRICARVSLKLVRQCDRCHAHDQKQRTPKAKEWRREHPPPAEEHALRHIEQNTPAWASARGGSSGASSLGTLMGWSEYRTSDCVWLEDMGLVVEPPRPPEEHFYCDHGHWYEDEARDLASLLLQNKISTTGLWLHGKFPFAHVSPDGFVEYPDAYECISAGVAMEDMLKGLAEIKCSCYQAYRKKNSVANHGFPHYLKPEHAIQKAAQMATMGASWSDYINYFHFNERSGCVPLLNGPMLYTTSDGGRTFQEKTPVPPFADGIRTNPTGCWMVSEILISRMYASPDFAALIYKCLTAHLAHVRNKKRPPVLYKINSPKFRWRPLLHAVFYLTGSPGFLQQACNLFDPSPIVQHIGSKKRRPVDWVGEWPPRLACAIQDFFYHDAVEVDLHMLRAW